MKLDQLLKPLLNYIKSDDRNPDIISVEMDSRLVKEGSLFICIQGFTVDGHDYANQAVANGAVAVIAQHQLELSVPVIIVPDSKRAMDIVANYFYNHPTDKLTLIGVTGTNGKTTTTHIIEKILRDNGEQTGLIGTMYTKVGQTVYETKNTTPESLTLQRYFQQMVEENVTVAVMEVSSHALHLGRVRGSDFNIAVFTNLTPDHLDYHETMEAYKHAKGLLFAQLGNTYKHNDLKVAILNQDDNASADYDKMTTAQVFTYGIKNKSDIMASNIKMTASGTEFILQTPLESKQVTINLIGTFSVYNVLAATAACLCYGIPLQKIVESLEQIDGVAGRFETVDENQKFTVIVDYAHTPDSLENVLLTIKELAKGDVYCIVGCGGDRDKTKRPVMAKIAADHATHAIFTSDNPRSEDAIKILEDMEQGVTSKDSYDIIPDREAAIRKAIWSAKDNDVVLIAGKGHETYQIIGNTTYDFDDREVARRAIKEREK
ncbi:UDP-N-acetylmuramoyl-L-alanyl-D-glutamate--2,6-diaminopimelate ligase [Bacillus alkalicellulosilyticus]|uniref:UDP-N-acetylmuramoyl-L-alanyl-D-glutamate--2, 6-diaminopimelate ligase n=1 Tax=Alkalihalobacterium alkalicellulosilyticum TaxID=1912214 RepID=UPI00099653A2|nr:UDP-N-acetylmuramoyl-L-alanyl-D-glutamate--2,6-diaminopimelate ligase [Bacillus alkalicellulosilyticus]